jgi:Copper amine oxidase N-terminal domain
MNIILKRSSILAILAAASLPGFAQDSQIRVIVNGERVHFDNVQPEEVDGRVLVPLRGVFEDLGAHVHWNASTETVNVDRHGQNVEVQIGSHRAMVDDREVNLDVPPILQADTTLVPLRFISEALGSDVDWRPAELTVAISTTLRDREPRRVAGEVVERDVFPTNLQLRIVLNDPISSRRSRRGDRFTATVTGENGGGRDFVDAKISGIVELTQSAIGGAPGVVHLRLDSIEFPDGHQVPISGRMVSARGVQWVQADDGNLMADGDWYRRGQNHNIDLKPGTELEIRVRRATGGMRRGDPGYPGVDGPMSNPAPRRDQNRPNRNQDGNPYRNQPGDDGGF